MFPSAYVPDTIMAISITLTWRKRLLSSWFIVQFIQHELILETLSSRPLPFFRCTLGFWSLCLRSYLWYLASFLQGAMFLIILLTNRVHWLPSSRYYTYFKENQLHREVEWLSDTRWLNYTCFLHGSDKKITSYLMLGTITARPLGFGESQHHKWLSAPACWTGKGPCKSVFLKPNLYTCGYHPNIALVLTMEGELRACFGSDAVMCFYFLHWNTSF